MAEDPGEGNESASLNGLVLRLPTQIGFLNSCPLGLGSFTHGGRGWRLKVNPGLTPYREDVANNLLEFLRMAITLWLSFIECKELKVFDEMIMILGDNTCAISWIFKSRLSTTSIYCNAVLFIARKFKDLVIDSKNFIDSQHLPGVLNLISDWLSFDGTSRIKNGKDKANPVDYDCSSKEVITHRILSAFPQLVPEDFHVSPLPTKILSLARQVIRIFESSLTQRQKLDLKAKTESREGGKPTATGSWVDQILILLEYPQRIPNLPA